MEEIIIPPEFDNHPIIGPTVKAFIKLLAEIAYTLAHFQSIGAAYSSLKLKNLSNGRQT